MTTKIWRGGMIGAGDWSPFQLKAWEQVQNADIVALCDLQPDRLAQKADQFHIPITYTDVETMLAETDLDFVDICTRPAAHAPLVKRIALQGLPILCQKPFCTTLDEAQDTVAFCDRVGVRLMINESFRWQPWYRQTKKLLNAEALGKPFLVHIAEYARLFMPHFMLDRQAYLVDMPQLLIYELMVHYLDALRYLFGEPETIYTRLHRISPIIKGEDVAVVIVGYPNLTCEITKSWASIAPDYNPDEPHFESDDIRIDGTKGTLHFQSDLSLHLYTESDHQSWAFPSNSIDIGRVHTQQHFVDCLANGEPFETGGTETLKTLALVYACYRSAEEGRVVAMSEFPI